MRTLAEIEALVKKRHDYGGEGCDLEAQEQLCRWVRSLAEYVDTETDERLMAEIGPLDAKPKRTITLRNAGHDSDVSVEHIDSVGRDPGGGAVYHLSLHASQRAYPQYTTSSLEEVCAKIAESAKQPDVDTDARSVRERMDEAIREPLIPSSPRCVHGYSLRGVGCSCCGTQSNPGKGETIRRLMAENAKLSLDVSSLTAALANKTREFEAERMRHELTYANAERYRRERDLAEAERDRLVVACDKKEREVVAILNGRGRIELQRENEQLTAALASKTGECERQEIQVKALMKRVDRLRTILDKTRNMLRGIG